MYNLSEIVKESKVRVNKIDSEIDYLEKERYKHKSKNDNHQT